ncbi:hypothetical protein RBE51_17625 [Pseudomonas taiwanensis]|uniref:hypothetical protein n=1 Tax=Pseudomonas taiwanensis TaxID=470150 RepID=UPI0028DE2E25|nr:hypothetical protein [Pseudomonas taiwanensis]MDT8924630.1 hypothetical protein [Pseudomonas taiwanensis]
MKIKPTLKTCNDLDLDDLQSLNLQTPLARMMQAVVEVMAQHPDLQNVHPTLPAGAYPDIEFPDANRLTEVDVHLCATLSDISAILDRDDDGCLGIFATTSGAFDTTAWCADRFRVIVGCDERELRNWVLAETKRDLEAHLPPRIETYVSAFLVTITHELAHAIEFIAHGAGLTPSEVDDAFDEGVLDVSLFDVCSGRGIREDMEADLSDQAAAELMEDRVERQGATWLDWALSRLPAELMQDCVRAYAPKQRCATLDNDGPSH